MKEMNKKQKLNKMDFSMILVLGILVLLMIVSVVYECTSLIKKSRLGDIDELRVAKTYANVQEGENVTASDNVKFDAYVLKDLNGDGYANKLRGTCKKIGENDTLYMELSIAGGGTFKNGKIEINGENFYLATGLVEDNVIKENYFSNNTKLINLKNINDATNTLITGYIQSGDYSYSSTKTSAINKGNINSISSTNNKITLSGIFVDESGEETIISKEVPLTVDWYGSLDLKLNNRIQNYTLDMDKSEIEFSIDLEETKNELLLSTLYVEGEIPKIEGYDPLEVTMPEGGTYDETTRKFVIKLDANVDENGNVIKKLGSKNTLNIICRYPQDAFVANKLQDKYTNIPFKAYCEAYNNENVTDKITRSNEINDEIVVQYTISPRTATYMMGLSVELDNRRYYHNGSQKATLSKKDATNAFVNIEAMENESQEYSTVWYWGRIDYNENDRIVLYQRYQDTFDSDNIASIINTGIKFTGDITKLLGEDGYIDLYNHDTNELIKRFKKDDFDKVYQYSDQNIKRIRLETSGTVKCTSTNKNDLGYIEVYNYKKIDNLNLPIEMTLEKLLEYKNLNTSYYYNDSYREQQIKLVDYTSDIELKSFQTIFSTQAPNDVTFVLNANNKIWKCGKFLVKFPKELTKVDIKNVISQNSNVIVSKYRTYKENGTTFLEIETTNNYDQEFSLYINANIEFDPLTMNDSYKVEAYGSNPNYEIYSLDKRVVDEYNLSNNSNYISYSALNINASAPNNIVTTESLLDRDGNVLARPSEQVEIDKSGLGGTRTIKLSVLNNYSSGSIKDVYLVGKVPFSGNKYQIANVDIKSEFSTTMTNDGVKVPLEYQNKVQVYYSENEIVNKNLNDESNNWTKTPTDFSRVKSYMIDLSQVNLEYGSGCSFTYDINLPENVDFNKASYSSHAVYFGLNTNEGIIQQSFETNKMGIVVAKKFDFELTKYEELSNNVVKNSTYSIEDDNSKILATTDRNGKIVVEGLYVEKEYVLKEEIANQDYEIDDQIIRFNTYVENGEFKINLKDGNVRSKEAIVLESSKAYANIAVDSKPKYILSINKYEKNTNNLLKGIKFELLKEDGEVNATTDLNGNIVVRRLLQDHEYTLKEIDAPGYEQIDDDIKFKITKENDDYKLNVINQSVRQDSNIIKQEGDIPLLTLNIENEKLNAYTFELSKLEKDKDTPVPNTVFNLKGKWISENGIELTTNENGILRADLYDGVEYTLQETKAADGYLLNDSIIKFKATRDNNGEWNFEVTEGEFKSEPVIEDGKIKVTLENESIFTIIKKDEDTGELLKGVKFVIYEVSRHEDGTESLSNAYDINGNVIGNEEVINGITYRVLETDESGRISKRLRPGLYKAVEVKALEGYDISDVNKYTYYFGIDKTSYGNSSLSLKYQRADIEALDIIKTNSGEYIAAHGNKITKYDSEFNLLSDIYVDGNEDISFYKIIQTSDNDFVAVSNNTLVKFDINGNTKWKKNNPVFYGQGEVINQDIINTSDGNILVAQDSRVDAYTSSFPDYIASQSGWVVLNKIDLSGTEIWKENIITQFDNWNDNKKSVNLLEDNEGNYLISITNEGIGDVIYKYDKNGNEIWGTKLGLYGGRSSIISIFDSCICQDGGYILVGTTKEYTQYGIYGRNSDELTGLIVKLDNNGKIVWMKENLDSYILLGIQKLNENYYVVQGQQSLYLYDNDFVQVGKYNFDVPMFSYYSKENSNIYNNSWSRFHVLDNSNIIVSGNMYANNKLSMLNVIKGADTIAQKQEIIVYNSLKEYNIYTSAGENGSISTSDSAIFEKVKHGKDSVKDIIITPNEGYAVEKIKINNDVYSFTEDNNGSVTLPKFKNVTENKYILATFAPKDKIGYVDVEYRELGTDRELLPKKEIRGVVGENYITSPEINIAGYTIAKDNLPQNSRGIVSENRITVVYYYTKQPVKITTKYLDVDTHEPIADEVIDYKNVNEEYTTVPLETIPSKYVFNSSTNNTRGIITGREEGNEITVEYYYKTKEFNIKTKLGTKGGTITGSDKDIYETVKYDMNSTKEIIVSADENWYIDSITVNGKEIGFTEDENRSYKLDTFTNVKEDIEVIANFKCKHTIVTVYYLDKLTNQSIAESEVIDVLVGEEYETFAKNIEGYNLIEEPINKKGVMGTEDIEVIYYYQKQVVEEPIVESEPPQTPFTGTNLVLLIMAILISVVTIILTNVKWKRGETNAK